MRTIHNLVFLSLLCSRANSAIEITIFSNFDQEKDRLFFASDFHKFVHDFGHLVDLKLYFNDSGPNVRPRICLLHQVKANIYLQATYLQCEAKRIPIKKCRKFFHINSTEFRACLNGATLEKRAERELSRVMLNASDLPAAGINGSTLKSVKYDTLQNAICETFKNKPAACTTKRSSIARLISDDKRLNILVDLLQSLEMVNDTFDREPEPIVDESGGRFVLPPRNEVYIYQAIPENNKVTRGLREEKISAQMYRDRIDKDDDAYQDVKQKRNDDMIIEFL